MDINDPVKCPDCGTWWRGSSHRCDNGGGVSALIVSGGGGGGPRVSELQDELAEQRTRRDRYNDALALNEASRSTRTTSSGGGPYYLSGTLSIPIQPENMSVTLTYSEGYLNLAPIMGAPPLLIDDGAIDVYTDPTNIDGHRIML